MLAVIDQEKKEINFREIGIAMRHLGIQPEPSNVKPGIYDPFHVEAIKDQLEKSEFGEFEVEDE